MSDGTIDLKPFQDLPEDGANTKTLKHGYRWGVLYGAIDPNSEGGKKLWGVIVGKEGSSLQ
jgi:hypothetical protein